jgi:hypothetical protein
MKPKRPTETDLLAIVQNGFQEQLPKDREAQAQAPAQAPAPSPAPATIAPNVTEPAAPVSIVRITLAIPEDLRYRLKLAMMDHRRKHRDRMTQDEFCAQAIAAHLDQDVRRANPEDQVDPLAAFLHECLRERGLTKGWAPKARALLDSLDRHERQASTP